MQRLRVHALALASSLLLACESSGSAKPEPAAEPAAEAPAEPAAEVPAEVPAEPAAAVAPAEIDPRSLCLDAGLLLTTASFEELAGGGYCDRCREHDEMACELDWPSSDVMACPEWDVMRNTIYARFGKPFTKPLWQAYFAKQPWYRADPSFQDERLPAVAAANVAYLKKAGDQCRSSCQEHRDEGVCVDLDTYLPQRSQ